MLDLTTRPVRSSRRPQPRRWPRYPAPVLIRADFKHLLSGHLGVPLDLFQ